MPPSPLDAPPALRAVECDITRLQVDAIVNAANPSLLGGGGVDGAIHRAAGPGLLAECRAIAEVGPGIRCPTGEARMTAGHGLPARWVVHTVGPVWRGGGRGEAALLASCYTRSLALAQTHGIASIAFPAISCGAYGYPPGEAVRLAVASVIGWQERNATALEVVFACFDAAMADRYHAVLAEGARGRER